ncbi:nuclear transport factor 2 family protein [Nocardia sp. CA-151230]|uniref:nuclear transport factor 2 family protein n=1 Tax=Nocardia sp. CA-151230 TaxID=3239982 RepID=UPI003D8A1416
MSTSAQLSLDNERHCSALLHQMYECVDGGRAEEALALFSPDAVFQTPLRVNRGTEEVRAALEKRGAQHDRRTRHVVTNVRMWASDADEVQLTGTLLLFVLSDPDPLVPSRIAQLQDTFVLRGGRWLIKSHGSTPLAERG